MHVEAADTDEGFAGSIQSYDPQPGDPAAILIRKALACRLQTAPTRTSSLRESRALRGARRRLLR
jgi:hypothetical protein